MVWLIIIAIQILLLVVWWRAAKFWVLLNQADVFLRKSKLFLLQHKFDKDTTNITKDQQPKYREWKVENFMLIVLVYLIFTVVPMVGTASMNDNSSTLLNVGVAVFLAVIGYLWNLTKIRVDILNIECDYINNLVNIIKGDKPL